MPWGIPSRTRSAVSDVRECWRIGLGTGGPRGAKQRQGDLKTPEGWYRTSDKPWSRFAGAIAVHYPNLADARAGHAAGRIDHPTLKSIRDALNKGHKPPQNTALGGEILIHGGGSRVDWTLGCVALDDDDLEVLRSRLPEGQAVDMLIHPGSG